jgi:hypothetical protein
MAEPIIDLVKRGSDDVVAHACGTCHVVMPTEGAARVCCTCHTCHAPLVPRHVYECTACRDARYKDHRAERYARDRARMLAATAVPESKHEGWVYWEEGEGHNKGFFASVEELREWCYGSDHEPPARVWACAPHGFSLDAQAIVDNELESGEYHESAGDCLDGKDVAALQTLLDDWVSNHAGGVETWKPTKTAVELDPAAWTEHVDERAAAAARYDAMDALAGEVGDGSE